MTVGIGAGLRHYLTQPLDVDKTRPVISAVLAGGTALPGSGRITRAYPVKTDTLYI